MKIEYTGLNDKDKDGQLFRVRKLSRPLPVLNLTCVWAYHPR